MGRVGTLALVAEIAGALVIAGSCWVMDYQPFDWVAAPRGTNVAMAYAQFGMNNAFNSTTAGTLPNSSLDSQIGVARYLHYDEAFGHIYCLDFILPFGTLANGKIDGQRVSDASGVADPVFSLGVWLTNEPDQKRWLSAVSFLPFPIGSYDRYRALNLGNNRW
ncbi:MAG: signal peptide protein [Rhodospirillales bacterium]|nr:signal peptide protein [Rhodospirillales bacterium]